ARAGDRILHILDRGVGRMADHLAVRRADIGIALAAAGGLQLAIDEEERVVAVGHLTILGSRLRAAGQTRMNCPPSTFSVWPVIHFASSDSRKIIASAMSCGVPRRANGMPATIAWIYSVDVVVRSAGVSVGPGAMPLMRMFCGPSSRASAMVRPFTASFATL